MERAIAQILRQYGTDMVLHHDGQEKTVRGFFQAVNAKSWQSMESQATLLGEISRGQYLYLGPAEVPVREGDVLALGQKQYLLRRVEVYRFMGKALYCWGLCVEKGVNDTWGSPS